MGRSCLRGVPGACGHGLHSQFPGRCSKVSHVGREEVGGEGLRFACTCGLCSCVVTRPVNCMLVHEWSSSHVTPPCPVRVCSTPLPTPFGGFRPQDPSQVQKPSLETESRRVEGHPQPSCSRRFRGPKSQRGSLLPVVTPCSPGCGGSR